MRDAIRKIPCFMPGMIESLRAWDLAYLRRINALEQSTYPSGRHEPRDWHIDRLRTIENQVNQAINNLSEHPCIAPNTLQNTAPETPPAQTPPPSTPKADAAPEHSSVAPPDNGGLLANSALAQNDWTALGNYGNFSPSRGSSADQWGLGVRGQFLLGDGWALNLGGAYNNVSGDHTSLNNWNVDASAVYYFADGRIGPTIGYQNNSENSYHADTWNYGAFGEYFFPNVTLSGKGGGFSTSSSFNNSDGYYLGGSVTGYLTPNLSLTGGVDFTHFSPHGGSSETDWTIRGTWRPCPTTPFSFWAGYTYSNFSPGSFQVDGISVGVMYDFGGGMTLRDSDRSGTVINQTTFTPLSLKY